MPVSHLSLRKGHSEAYLDAISESLHLALVECFEVPPDDRFQIIHQLDGHEMRFDRHYLAGPRSEDWLLIEITAGRPRSEATKRSFYRRLAERLQSAAGIASVDVMVVIHFNEAADWSFGSGLATLLDAKD